MVKCSIPGCEAASATPAYKGVTFHRLPDPRCFPRLYGKWLRLMAGIPEDADETTLHLWKPTPSTRVCSSHFTANDFVPSLDKNRRPKMSLRPDAFPSQQLPQQPIIRQTKEESVNGVSAYPLSESRSSTSSATSRCTPININDGFRHNIDSLIFRSNNSFGDNNNIKSPTNTSPSAISEDNQSVGSEQEVSVNMLPNERIKVEPCKFMNVISRNNEDQQDIWSGAADSPANGPQDDQHIPLCYRMRKNQMQSNYVFGVTLLKPEHGISVLLVNDNKFLKCELPQDDRQTWRCIIKSCLARVETSAVHETILLGASGQHYHLPTRLTPINPQHWLSDHQEVLVESLNQEVSTTVPLPPPWTIGRKWQEVNTEYQVNDAEQTAESSALHPPWVKQPSEFDSSSFLQQSVSRNDVNQPQMGLSNVTFTSPAITYPVFSSIEELSKFCNGPVIQCLPPNSEADQQLALTTTLRGNLSYSQPHAQEDNSFMLLNGVNNEHTFESDEEALIRDEVCYTLPNIPPVTGIKRSFDQSECSTLEMGNVAKTKRQLDLVSAVDVEDIIRKDSLAVVSQPWDEGVVGVGVFPMR